MAFCCGGTHKIAPWTRAKRVPRRVPGRHRPRGNSFPPAGGTAAVSGGIATRRTNLFSLILRLATAECEAPRSLLRMGATSRQMSVTHAHRVTVSVRVVVCVIVDAPVPEVAVTVTVLVPAGVPVARGARCRRRANTGSTGSTAANANAVDNIDTRTIAPASAADTVMRRPGSSMHVVFVR
jgi:hypothetical protein